MNGNLFIKSLVLFSIAFLLFECVVVNANQNSKKLDAVRDFEALEEKGLDDIDGMKAASRGSAHFEKELLSNIILEQEVLLIPNSIDDNVGMYDPEDGTYLGLFITGYEGFATPINAVPGPDGDIYISDQLADAVYVFDTLGNYLYTYADGADGLDNIRGIDFRGGHLFVTSGDDYVAEFDGPHSRLPNFINDGSDPFDIMFLDDGRALLADIQGSADNVRLYNSDGTLAEVLFSVAFPEQIQIDALAPGAYLNASFSDDQVTDFELDGTIQQMTPWDGGRGAYRLGNDNLLVTSSDGVFEIEPITGSIIEQENAGSGRFIELYIPGDTVGVNEDIPDVPGRYSMSQNYPNPFNAATTIQYSLSEANYVVIDIYDLLGNKIETLLNEKQPAGHHQVIWEAEKMPSGTYFYRIQAGEFAEAKKMLLLK